MQRTNPFARARAMMAAIQTIVLTAPNPFDAQMRINDLGPYASRGHGRGKTSGVRAKAYAKMRHQGNRSVEGKQEIARRLRASAVPVSRREWYAVAPDAVLGEEFAFVATTREDALRSARSYGFTTNAPVLARSLLEVANG